MRRVVPPRAPRAAHATARRARHGAPGSTGGCACPAPAWRAHLLQVIGVPVGRAGKVQYFVRRVSWTCCTVTACGASLKHPSMPKYIQRARRRPARKSAEMATEGKAPNRYVCCPPRAPAAERWPTPRSRLGRVIACAAPAASATAHAAAAARRKRPKAVPLAAGPRVRANARERVRKGTHSHPGVRRQTRCRNRRGLRRLRGSAAFAAKRHWRRLTLDFRPCIPCCRRH